MSFLGLGFVLGLTHAFDADHVVAVSSLVSKHNNVKKGILAGIIWGLGHTTTIFIIGLIILITKITIPEKIALSLEFIVGIMIVYLGASVIYDVIKNKKHLHKHSHEGVTHFHLHSHKKKTSHTHYHKPFIVGLIHGMAGSAGLMLIVLSTAKDIISGIYYILFFGIGLMIAMSFASGLISLPFILTSKKSVRYNKNIKYATGIFSILFGLSLMLSTGLLIF